MKNFNNTKKAVLVAVVLAVSLLLSVLISAEYDSTEDPLITLSYLTKYVDEAIRAALEKENTPEDTENTEIPGDTKKPEAPNTTPASTGFVAIKVEYGQEVQCSAATEIILRSGSAVIVSPFEDQGLSDLTEGLDLKNGQDVPKNHNLLIPRGDDGRGIRITSTNGAYLMVGGAYKIVEP